MNVQGRNGIGNTLYCLQNAAPNDLPISLGWHRYGGRIIFIGSESDTIVASGCPIVPLLQKKTGENTGF